jgi:hypothetical protein
VYRGTCDASAAVRLGSTSLFATASDEDFVLRVYDRGNPGDALAIFDLKSFLAPANPKKEPDIEGAAQVGDRIYWIGSHGRDKDAVVQESRHRLFATSCRLAGGKAELRPHGVPYRNLIEDLLASPDLSDLALRQASTRPPEADGGLNIEGLAPTREGHLLIGFRNPIPQGRALIVRLENPSDAIQARRSPLRLTRAALLDLGGRGIRALEFVPEASAYVIVAGAFDDRSDFRLFRWSGSSTDRAEPVDVPGLADLRPEELIVVPASDGTFELDVFSDDGDALVGSTRCKKLENPHQQAFRSLRVRLAAL